MYRDLRDKTGSVAVTKAWPLSFLLWDAPLVVLWIFFGNLVLPKSHHRPVPCYVDVLFDPILLTLFLKLKWAPVEIYQAMITRPHTN